MAFFRRVLEEFEAHLSPPATRPSQATGKSERKRYGNGEERIKIKARGLNLQDGTPVQILINGEVYTEVSVTDGRIRLDLTSADGPVPQVTTGDVLELVATGGVYLSGTYQPD